MRSEETNLRRIALAPYSAFMEKTERIQRILDELYPDAPIPLEHRDPFTLLVAVLLSAQTTDKRVNLVTPALFARADTPQKMSRVPVAEIHALIRTCGLAPAKAKNIAALSKILVEKHGGVVPRTLEELEALPGVGHKTASVVLCQAFRIPAFPVDTHIHRLAERWGLSSGRSVEQTERDLKAAFPESSWIRLHLQMILFGREHCPALRHDPAGCPICSWAATGRAAPRKGAKAAQRTPVKRAVAKRKSLQSRAARSPTVKRAARRS
jgi:endonuclease-3